MTSVRLAAFDLDGTLLSHGALTREAIFMLKALRRNEVTVVIATGRHRGTVPLRLNSPKLVDYLICTNGAVVTPSGRGQTPLFEKSLSGAELKALMDLGKRFDCRYAVSVGRTTFLSKAEPLRRRKTDGGSDTKQYFWRYYMYPLHARTVESWNEYLRRPDAKAEKVVCTCPDVQTDLAFRASAETQGLFTATGSNQAAEITVRGVSKGSALAFLADKLGIPREAVVAFGNDDNDLAMKPYAGRFVAAKDSSPATLSAADEVADSIPRAALRLCLSQEKEAKA